MIHIFLVVTSALKLKEFLESKTVFTVLFNYFGQLRCWFKKTSLFRKVFKLNSLNHWGLDYIRCDFHMYKCFANSKPKKCILKVVFYSTELCFFLLFKGKNASLCVPQKMRWKINLYICIAAPIHFSGFSLEIKICLKRETPT